MEEIEVVQNQHQRKVAIIIAVVLCVSFVVGIVSGISLYSSYTSSIRSVQSNNQEVSGVQRKNIYPNPQLTPGDIFVGVTKDVICVTGYTKTVRDVPLSLKKEIYSEYNIVFPQPTGAYELDHFIPLALGGSNDPKNLWPEPAEPKPGFHEKDVVEVYLLDQVCHHNFDLQKAQESVRVDWYAVYESIPNKKEFMY